MLYETLSQPIIFLYLCLAGFLTGILFDFCNIILFYIKKNKIIKQILLFFCVFLTLFVFFAVNLKVNYGNFRFYTFFVFFFSLILQRFLVKNFVAKPIVKCYNHINEKRKQRKSRREKTKSLEKS